MEDDYGKYPDYVVTAGMKAKHYHKPKWKKNGPYGFTERLATVCGRDSAIYLLTIMENDSKLISQFGLLPCGTCFAFPRHHKFMKG